MTTTTPPTNDLTNIEQDTRMMLIWLIGAAVILNDLGDGQKLRWMQKRVRDLTADVQTRTREAVSR